MPRIDLVEHLEKLASEVAARTNAAGAEVDLAGVRFRQFREFAEAFHRH